LDTRGILHKQELHHSLIAREFERMLRAYILEAE